MFCFAPGRKLLVLFRVSRNFSHGIKVLFPKKFAACCALPLEGNYWYYSGSLESNLTSQKFLPPIKFAEYCALLLQRNYWYYPGSLENNLTSQKVLPPIKFAEYCALLLQWHYWYYSGSLESNLTSQKVLPAIYVLLLPAIIYFYVALCPWNEIIGTIPGL